MKKRKNDLRKTIKFFTLTPSPPAAGPDRSSDFSRLPRRDHTIEEEHLRTRQREGLKRMGIRQIRLK
jgi:hypothetical protein